MFRAFFCLAIGLLLQGSAVWAGPIEPLRSVDLVSTPTSDQAHETEEKKEQPEANDSSKKEKSSNKEDAKKTDSKEEDESEKEEEDSKEDKKTAKSKEEEKKKPEPFKVEAKSLKIDVELDGVFVAQEMKEVELRPEVWSTFKVLEAVEHGARVKKGDVLVRFDDEKLEERLAKESLDQRLAELSLMQAEETFSRLEKTQDLSYAQARRSFKQFEEDVAYYENTDRPFYEKIAHYRFKDAKEGLASQQEELQQLVKMYEADDLTEETEAIVLRRQRFHVETAELIMELQTASRDYTLNVMLSRLDESYATSLKKAKLDFEQVKATRKLTLTQARYQMEKKRKSRAKSIEEHAKLVSDRALMVLRAPVDGIVYYGKCTKGKWGQVASLKTKLKPLGSVSAKSVVMTIIEQRPLLVETSVGEKDFPNIAQAMPVVLTPTGDSDLELPGKVTKVETVHGGSKKYEVQLSVDTSDAPDWLVAGMTCKAKVTVYENKEALLVPSDLVQTDEDNEKLKYVLLVDSEEDEPVRRKVKLGRRKDKKVEILKGLEAGDEIVKPEEDEKSKD